MIDQTVLEKLEFNKILNSISNYAITENGKQLVLSLKPELDFNELKLTGNLINSAKDVINKSGYPPIDYIQDLKQSLYESKIEGAVLSSNKVLETLKLAKTSRLILFFLKKEVTDLSDWNSTLPNLFNDKLFEHNIEKIINEFGEVKENASTTLQRIRKEINSKRTELVKSINRIIKNLKENDIVREDYLTLRDGRMVIPVKAEHKRHIRGFIHSESSTGQTVYIEPEETLDLNNDIISLSFEEKREIERLLKELTRLIGNNSNQLILSLESLAYIDSIFARARYSIEIVGCLPQLDNSKSFLVLDARHPILLKKLTRKNTVPLSFELKEKIVVITGPNAGGKTVVLKTIGILSLMLKAGIHIPVSPDSNFHLFNNILVDIGDQQSIEDDLSTFSSHLLNLKNILETADENSLVLLDEIGTGTDPAEGSALAASILNSLLNKRATVFTSTHHGSLKVFAYNINGMQNAAMQFDHTNLTPTYKFELGIPGSSYAFEIAKRAGLNSDIIKEAENFIDTDKHNLEKFLSELEEKSNKLNKKLNEYEIENTRLKGLSDLYKKSYDKIESEKKDILKKVKQDAENYLSGVNKKIEKVIKELRETNASKDIIKEARKIVNEIKAENINLFTDIVEEQPVKHEFKIGDFVAIKNSNTSGKLIEMNKKGKATILSGSIKMQADIDDLILSKAEKNIIRTDHSVTYQITDSNFRLDIRGHKPEEAEFEIIKFLDGAYSSSIERVEILHGKGTGVLKKTVWEILKHYDHVKNYYFAPIQVGGDGITIIEFN